MRNFGVFVRPKEIASNLAILQLYGHKIDHERKITSNKKNIEPSKYILTSLVSGASYYTKLMHIFHTSVKTSNCVPGIFVILM